MHNLFLQIKFILAGFRCIRHLLPVCQSRYWLGTCSKVSTRPAPPALANSPETQPCSHGQASSGLRFWPSWQSTALPPQTVVPGQPRVQPAPSPDVPGQQTCCTSFLALCSCSSPCSLHTAFLESFFPNPAFKQEQHRGKQAKAGSEAMEENISSLGSLITYLPGTPTYCHILLSRAGHMPAPRRQSCLAQV